MIKEKQREFSFSKKDFSFLAELVFAHTGIVLKENKFEMVYSRLARRIRKIGLSSFKEYVAILKGNEVDTELAFLVDAITTNLTKFFRESYQLKDYAVKVLQTAEDKAKNGGEKKLRIWSAACSSGQEPYSIAMVTASYLKNYKDWDIKILATDIDRNMLEKGRLGEYSADEISNLPEKFSSKYISEGEGGSYSVSPELRKLISFKHLNLLHEWPIKNSFDVIFCRNVLIYFNNETKEKLVDGFSKKLKPSGMLYLGHSEALIQDHADLCSEGRASFRKAAL